MSVKRFWLVAAVGALAALTASLGGSTAYGGSSSASAAAPIKIGAITPLTANFAPWGIQVRAGMALAVNEINRTGGVKGRGQGRKLNLVVADDQSTNTNAAIDGFRRLTQQEGVVAIGGIIGSSIGLATSRLAEEAKVPLFLVKSGNNEILTQSSPLHVPHLPALRCHGRSVGRAVRAASFDHERGRDDRRLRVGPVVQVVARGFGQVHAERQVQRPGCAGPDDQLHAVSARVRRRVVDRGDGPSARRAAGPGSGSTAGPEGAGVGCRRAVVAHREERGGDGVRPLQRLQVHGHGDQAVQDAREALPADVPAERVLRGRRARRLRVREDRRAGDPERRDEPAGDRGLRPQDDVQHPRVRVPAQMDGVG